MSGQKPLLYTYTKGLKCYLARCPTVKLTNSFHIKCNDLYQMSMMTTSTESLRAL